MSRTYEELYRQARSGRRGGRPSRRRHTDQDAWEMRVAYLRGAPVASIMEEFNASASTVRAVTLPPGARGATYRDVPYPTEADLGEGARAAPEPAPEPAAAPETARIAELEAEVNRLRAIQRHRAGQQLERRGNGGDGARILPTDKREEFEVEFIAADKGWLKGRTEVDEWPVFAHVSDCLTGDVFRSGLVAVGSRCDGVLANELHEKGALKARKWRVLPPTTDLPPRVDEAT